MTTLIKSIILSFTFLTWIPITKAINFQPSEFRLSISFYPIVGLFLGSILLLTYTLSDLIFPVQVTAAAMLAVSSFSTRFLHLDGFIDCMDGFFGGNTPERRLEILKDPHVGAFGVIGGISLLLLKYTLLISLLTLPASNYIAILLFPCISRWTMVLSIIFFKYIRTDGIGSIFQEGTSYIPLIIASTATILICFIIANTYLILIPFIAASLWAILFNFIASKLLNGGITGDCYGAVNETSEVISIAIIYFLLTSSLATWVIF
jgi:adenosylcobinamide-GDP ribazoletransferase